MKKVAFSLMILGFLTLSCVFISECNIDTPADKLQTESYVIASMFVEESTSQLANPENPTPDYTAEYLGDNTYRVDSYINIPDSAGVIIKKYYNIKLRYNKGKPTDRRSWTLGEVNYIK